MKRSRTVRTLPHGTFMICVSIPRHVFVRAMFCLISAPGRVLAQNAGLTLTELIALQSAGVPRARVLFRARESCIAFRPSPDSEARLRQAGATAALLAELRT